MKRIALLSAALIVAVISYALPVKGNGSYRIGIVTADNVNLRMGPGTEYDLVTEGGVDWQGKPYSDVLLPKGMKDEELLISDCDESPDWYFAKRPNDFTPFYIHKRYVKALETAGFPKPDNCKILIRTERDNPMEEEEDDSGCFVPSAEALFIFPDGTCLLHHCGFENYVELGELNEGTAVFDMMAFFREGEGPIQDGAISIDTKDCFEISTGKKATLEAAGIKQAAGFDIPAWYIYKPEVLRRIFEDLKSKEMAIYNFSYQTPEKFNAEESFDYTVRK